MLLGKAGDLNRPRTGGARQFYRQSGPPLSGSGKHGPTQVTRTEPQYCRKPVRFGQPNRLRQLVNYNYKESRKPLISYYALSYFSVVVNPVILLIVSNKNGKNSTSQS